MPDPTPNAGRRLTAAQRRALASQIVTEATPEMLALARDAAGALFTQGRIERHLSQRQLESILVGVLWRWENRDAEPRS